MPNLFAYGMLILWPFAALLLFKKYDTLTATFWTIVGGFMFLPAKTVFDFPLLPPLGKDEISALSACLGCILIKKVELFKSTFQILHKNTIILFFLILLIPFINVYFNQEPMFDGQLWIRGLTIYDAASQVVGQFIVLLPYIIGINVIKKPEDLHKLIELIVKAGILYSILVLIEVRLSPILHSFLYGFFPHNFGQQIRFGGFRAVVFMGHGLLVAGFYLICLGAAAIRFKISSNKEKPKSLLILLYFLFILIVCKSVGPLLLGLLTIIVILSIHIRLQSTFVKVIFLLFMAYPTFSILGLIPYDDILNVVRNLSFERAQSLETRFYNEDVMIRHAFEKWAIGWGSWGRNRFFDSISDGYWLIVYGQYGAFYFFSIFWLFGSYSFMNAKYNNNMHGKTITVGLGVILACVLIDQIPNSSLEHSWLWFLCGIVSSLHKSANTKFDNETSRL